jgi:flotillin
MVIVLVLTVVIVLFIVIVIWATHYRRARPDQALLISGGTGHYLRLNDGRRIKVGFRIIPPGTGTFVWPVIERMDAISLELVQIDSRFDLHTADRAPLAASYMAQIRVGGDELSIARAAERFLYKTPREIAEMVRLILDDGVRTALCGMRAAELAVPRAELAARLGKELVSRLAEAGISLEQFVIGELQLKD